MERNIFFPSYHSRSNIMDAPEPRQHYEAYCGQCNWWGMKGQMKTIYNPNPSEPGDAIPELGCPICLSDRWIEYEEELGDISQRT